MRIPAFDLKPPFSIAALKRQIYFKAPFLVSRGKTCQGGSACLGRAAAHWGSAHWSCFPATEVGELLSPHPGTHLSAQQLLPWDANGKTEGGCAILASKRAAEGAVTRRSVSEGTIGAGRNRRN